MIRRNIEVEARLIDDLLDVTGIARGKLALKKQIVDVRALLEHAMQNYCATAAARKDLQVSIDMKATNAYVLADSSRMTQVFWNLLQNACKFTPEGGKIDISLHNESCALIIEISDTGIGISPENMPRIFNAFEQGERTRTRVFGGLGLGLAISRAIVELHGGTILAESEGRDKGTRLRICLPTVEGATARETKKTAPASAAESGRHQLHILLVEDHADTAHQLTRLLQRAGHEVTWAGSVREARDLIAHRNAPLHFDILISDLGLPDGTGHDVMRDLAATHSIPGIALSGYGMTDDIRDSIAAGFSRHITKPVDWHELNVAIQTIAAGEPS
jgi:two-component system CheB/CheR fusion protein